MAEQFYHHLITEKSFRLLQNLNRQFDFILIGGWAVWLYTRALKSKDIDLILDYDELARLKEQYEVFKNERLHKYEIKQDGIDVDIYLPHYSKLGLAAEEIKKHVSRRQGWRVPKLEVLFLLKLFAYAERQGTLKGKKDGLDILSLAFLPEFGWQKYQLLVSRFNFKTYSDLFIKLLKSTVRAPELQVNEQKMAKLKKRILTALV